MNNLASRLGVPPKLVALTGITGFVGSHIAEALVENGYRVRAIARVPTAASRMNSVELLAGSLEDRASLEQLVDGADWVVHAAGKVRVHDVREFAAANVDGTRTLLQAIASKAPEARFMAISSLAAREPTISAYAASKAAAERLVACAPDPSRHVIVRPPAIYGPGDRATLPIFAQLAKGLLLVPATPSNRFSLLHVHDLAALLIRIIETDANIPRPLEPDDSEPNGYGWAELAAVAERTCGQTTRVFGLPRWLLAAIAPAAELAARVTGTLPVLARDKVAELFHPDWVADTASSSGIPWQARTRFDTGFASTLAWYYQAGWLKRPSAAKPSGIIKGTPRA